jgi:hypothetical protein
MFIEEQWPFLPPVPFFDSAQEKRTFGQVIQALESGFVGVAIGNPSHAPVGSPLRRFTDNDVGHAIMLERGKFEGGKHLIWVMDPMAPAIVGGEPWKGQWVPAFHVRKFTDVDDAQKHVKVSMFKRGDASPAARARKRLQQQIKDSKDDIADLAELRKTLANVRQELSDAQQDLKRKAARITELENQLADLDKDDE